MHSHPHDHRTCQDLCQGGHQALQISEPVDPPRRDLRAAGTQRRGQDHADRHRLRPGDADLRQRASPTATTWCATSARRARSSASCRRNSPPTPSRPSGPRSASAAGCSAEPPDPALLEQVLRDLSLWDKKDSKIMTLSGGMKRRVLIAKALVARAADPVPGRTHRGRRRRAAPRHVERSCASCATAGVTIILTTHYIEEAEEMADRIGVISRGELILVEDKAALMQKLGRKQLTLHLQEPLAAMPPAAARLRRSRSSADGTTLVYGFESRGRAAPRITGAAARARGARHRIQGPADHARARSRTSSSSLVRGAA